MDCGDQEKEKQGLVSLGQQVGFAKKKLAEINMSSLGSPPQGY